MSLGYSFVAFSGSFSSSPLCFWIFCSIRFIYLAEWIYEPKAGSALASRRRQEVDSFLAQCRFKASFPWAKKKEEDHERQYVREHFEKTSSDETAGNLWIHPSDGKSLHFFRCIIMFWTSS